MSKHNLFIKKIQKQILSVNSLIESYFNNIKYFKKSLYSSNFEHYSVHIMNMSTLKY